MKAVMASLALCIFAVVAYPQVPKATDELILDAGVKRHTGIDEVYRKFSKAYRDLDASAFENLYTKDAAYLVPGKNIDVGIESIVKGFRDFFGSIRAQSATLEISFRIIQRKVSGTLGYDVGIYSLRTLKDGIEVNSGRGKFVVVAIRDGKHWKFQVDGYSDMP